MAFIALTILHAIFQATLSQSALTISNLSHSQYNCNSLHPCHNITFNLAPSHHINIICNNPNSCNNISIASTLPTPHNHCNIHCDINACINILPLSSHCSCHGHCTQFPIQNRRLLTGTDDFSDLPDYVYLIIIAGLVLICGICLCVLCCKWQREREINRNMSARAKRNEFAMQYNDEEQRSLSGTPKNETQTDTTQKSNHIMLDMMQQKHIQQMSLSPENIPLSDHSRAMATSPIKSMDTTPSPRPFNPSLLQNRNFSHVQSHESQTSHSNVISTNDHSQLSQQMSSQQSSQPHPGITIIMQPVPSPNTTPQSNTITKEMSSGHKAIIGHKKQQRREFNSYSMDSVSSLPYAHRKESITVGALKEDVDSNTKTHTEIISMANIEEKESEIDEIIHRKSRKEHLGLESLDVPHREHEKSNSNFSGVSVPFSISVMTAQQSGSNDHSDGMCNEIDSEHGIKGDNERILREKDEPLSAPNNESEMDHKEEIQQMFGLNDNSDSIVSDHEIEYKKKKKKRRKKDKKHKKKKKKKKRKKSKNAIKNAEVEYEPQEVDKEGLDANHRPPPQVMGRLPLELARQVAKDKDYDQNSGLDVQSTVSSHPAYDAKELKHFNVDGVITGMVCRESKEDDDGSSDSGTSDSDEYSYTTSNEDEYEHNDNISVASADPQSRHNLMRVKVKPPNHGFIIESIKEDQILVTPKSEDTPDGHSKRNTFNKARLTRTEFFTCLYDEICLNKNENFNSNELYALIISFLKRKDRWLNCRLVCKTWHELVHTKCWIFTEYMTMAQAHMLKPGNKVDHRDDPGRWIKSSIMDRNGTLLNIHYDGWSSKFDSWCDYSTHLNKFAVAKSNSRFPALRGQDVQEKMLVDIKPSYRHGKNCNWRKGKVKRLDDYSGQIEVIYKYKGTRYLLWVHLDNRNEVDRLYTHTTPNVKSNNNLNLANNLSSNRHSNYSLATTIQD